MLVKNKQTKKSIAFFYSENLKYTHAWYCVVHFKSNVSTLLLF